MNGVDIVFAILAVALVAATAYVLIGGLAARLREPWPAPCAERAVPLPFATAAARGQHRGEDLEHLAITTLLGTGTTRAVALAQEIDRGRERRRKEG